MVFLPFINNKLINLNHISPFGIQYLELSTIILVRFGTIGNHVIEIVQNVGNPSGSLSPTLSKNKKVEHHIRIKAHKRIMALRFWVESGVNVFCDWTQVSLVLYLSSETSSVNLTQNI